VEKGKVPVGERYRRVVDSEGESYIKLNPIKSIQ